MKPREYEVMCMAVETGVAYGWTRANKHNDNPGEGPICDEMTQAVIAEICEWFTFGPENED